MNYKSELKPYREILLQINEQRARLEEASESWLQEKATFLKARADEGVVQDELLIEAFALACEVSRRQLEMRPYDVQVLAALAMNNGNLAELQTGEGKTLAAVLTAYLNGLSGKGVHILTFNDYLARRDAEWMGPVYRFLGLTVSAIQEGMSIRERKEAYQADIVYMTAKEAGFDFLRDHRCLSQANIVHRPFHFAIVDEADSILIDEARVPLVIAGEISAPNLDPIKLAGLIANFDEHSHYYRDEYSRDVNFTETGLDYLEQILHIDNLHAPEHNQLLSALNLALQAEVLLKRDIDYIIREGKVELVDAFTGRVAENRRWPYGLQTAIEAKEKLEIQPEGMILGSITLQHFLQLYPKVAGMTATAKTSADESREFYGLEVILIPPNKTCNRVDEPDVVFTHQEAKLKGLLTEIAKVHAVGRPILVGTASVEESQQLADKLEHMGIRCNVLNAKNDEKEAAIVAEAGALGAVTISTNMAGRGTDIRLGGSFLEDYEEVISLGGLYVIGTNRHESRRIDNQLRGRCGRQGDPGSSRFFISLEDDLMVRYRIYELIPSKLMPKRRDDAIHHRVVAREIARAQRIIEGQNFEIRKTLRNYSYVLEEQRQIIQGKRTDILMEKEEIALFRENSFTSERFERLEREFGDEVLKKVSKQITLFHIDRFWMDHLEHMSQVKEGIHLLGFAGQNPALEFRKIAIQDFATARKNMELEMMETFANVTVTANGIDLEKEGLKRPSATWTYLVNDMPFANPLFGALVSSNAFAFGAAVVMLQYLPLLPFILIGRIFKRLIKKH
jgi:preprotein translocase subunit SecA